MRVLTLLLVSKVKERVWANAFGFVKDGLRCAVFSFKRMQTLPQRVFTLLVCWTEPGFLSFYFLFYHQTARWILFCFVFFIPAGNDKFERAGKEHVTHKAAPAIMHQRFVSPVLSVYWSWTAYYHSFLRAALISPAGYLLKLPNSQGGP